MSIVSRTPMCRWLLATVSALALSSSSLLAQDASGETSASDDAGVTMLEAIVVQARKRGENPQDVPISMTVVGQDELEKSEIKGTDELIRRAPNLSIADSGIPKTSRFIIRGSGAIGMDSPDDTSVGVYLDGIPIPKQLAEIGFLDVEQVEVLRGPQGTLFGQNSTAGAINILSVEPDDVMSFRLGSEFGTGGHRDVRFSFNAPIVPDTVYGRFSGYYRGQNGWIPDLNLGHKADSAEAWAGRGVIKILPNDQSDITISFDALKSESDNPSFLWKDAPGYPVISRDIPEIAERDTIGLGITANYHFDNFTLTSVTGLRRLNLHTRTDNYGYCGRGVAMATAVGQLLARAMRTGRTLHDLPVPNGTAPRMPPDPFKSIGVVAVTQLYRLIDRVN